MKFLETITHFINSFFKKPPQEDYLTWTPSEAETRQAVHDFLSDPKEMNGSFEFQIRSLCKIITRMTKVDGVNGGAGSDTLYPLIREFNQLLHTNFKVEDFKPENQELQHAIQATYAHVEEDKVETLLRVASANIQNTAVLEAYLISKDWIANAISNDPALSTKDTEEAAKEVLTYQGLHAIAFHRHAHEKYTNEEFAEARKISQGVRRLTAGIEIHPGAKIGKNFFIDHGSGVVIGETADIGDNVMLYHRVTLGNDGKRINGGRRHPKIGNDCTLFTGVEILGPATIGDDVIIGAGTKIIGDVKIGKGARINPQLLITTDIPENARVIGTNNGTPVFANNKVDGKLRSSASASEMDYDYVTLPEWQTRMSQEKQARFAKDTLAT